MQNLEDTSHLIEEAELFGRKMQSKIDAGEAANFTEAEAELKFQEMFDVDRQRDKEQIKAFLRRLYKDPEGWGSVFIRPEDYELGKSRDELKYSDEQIEAEEWHEQDIELVINELKQAKFKEYFGPIAEKYLNTAVFGAEGLIRLDQQHETAERLRQHRPILIRGIFTIGKTSLARSIGKQEYGDSNSLSVLAGHRESRQERFKKNFGLSDVSEFIARHEFSDLDYRDKEDQIGEEINASGKTPFEFLNDYLLNKGERVFVCLDEATGLAEDREVMEYYASLKDLSQVDLAIILPRIVQHEDDFREIFKDYETVFVRPLTVEEVGMIVRKPLEGTLITFTDEAVQKIFEFTGGRPMEVNRTCSALMGPDSPLRKYRFNYRGQDIESFAERSYRQLTDVRGNLTATIEEYGQRYDTALSTEEQIIVERIAKEKEVSISEIDASVVRPLIDLTFIVRDDHNGVYRINGELLRKVFANQARVREMRDKGLL